MDSRPVILVALGSAGDVHPFVGLALELKNRGHAVTIATNPKFESLIRTAGIDFFPLGTVEEFDTTLMNPDLWHPRKGFKLVMEFGLLKAMRPVYEFLRDHWKPGTIVGAHALAIGARIFSETHNMPFATLHLAPVVIRSFEVMPVLPGAPFRAWQPKWMKRALFWIADKSVIDGILKKPINQYRSELGLKNPVSRIMKDWWVSPQMVIGLFPPFFGPPQMDWDRNISLTSFPLYDARGIETVSPELEEFLHAGEPPIVFTPGSANLHAKEFFETARTSCLALKKRGLFLSPYAENKLDNLPPTIKHFAYAPLSQILSRCAAQVCHGGIGTVAQAIAAGIPQIVMALGHDQYDNGTRVERLGIGHWRKARYFKSHWLTPALNDILTNPKVTAAVAECKAKLAAHNGIMETCDLLESL